MQLYLKDKQEQLLTIDTAVQNEIEFFFATKRAEKKKRSKKKKKKKEKEKEKSYYSTIKNGVLSMFSKRYICTIISSVRSEITQ